MSLVGLLHSHFGNEAPLAKYCEGRLCVGGEGAVHSAGCAPHVRESVSFC